MRIWPVLFMALLPSLVFASKDEWIANRIEIPPFQMRIEYALKTAPAVIVFSDLVDVMGTTKDQDIDLIIALKIAELDARRSALAGLSFGPAVIKDPPAPPTPPVPDPARDAFIAAQDLMLKYRALVEGKVSDSKGDYTARLATAEADYKMKYKEEYLPLVRGQ